jgi:hypothetical protein
MARAPLWRVDVKRGSGPKKMPHVSIGCFQLGKIAEKHFASMQMSFQKRNRVILLT